MALELKFITIQHFLHIRWPMLARLVTECVDLLEEQRDLSHPSRVSSQLE